MKEIDIYLRGTTIKKLKRFGELIYNSEEKWFGVLKKNKPGQKLATPKTERKRSS